MKKALITGITGQDGSYLAELLINKNYQVHGVIRRNSVSNSTHRINKLINLKNITLHYGDMCDLTSLVSIIKEIMPNEIYNLAAQSHVKISFSNSTYTSDVNALGTLRLLESIKILGLESKVKFYQASTSEMFGKVKTIPQRETTEFHPRSPYGVAKLYAYWITKNYREAYNIFTSNGILFNHESPRRGLNFVTRKITKTLSEIKKGHTKGPLTLGNLEAERDWGHAKDYVEAMWLMLQRDAPDDYVIATGEKHSVKSFLEIACKYIGFDIEWEGAGLDQVAINKNNGEVLVAIDPKYFRPAEVDTLVGDPSKAKKYLGWEPKYSFTDLVEEMCNYDLQNNSYF